MHHFTHSFNLSVDYWAEVRHVVLVVKVVRFWVLGLITESSQREGPHKYNNRKLHLCVC